VHGFLPLGGKIRKDLLPISWHRNRTKENEQTGENYALIQFPKNYLEPFFHEMFSLLNWIWKKFDQKL
jgi:hypothetical protein